MKHITYITPFFLLTLAACSAEHSGENSASSHAALLSAPVDTSDKYSVGVCGSGLVSNDAGTAPVGECLGHRCTGTLVAPNLVLTSRHCVSDPVYADNALFCQGTFSGPITTAKVTLGDSAIDGEPKWLNVTEQFFPTNLNDCDDDIALLVLSNNVAASDASPIAVDVDTDIAANPASAYTVVGRGVITDQYDLGNGTESFDAGGLTRRIIQNIPVVCTGIALIDGGADAGSCSVVDYSSPDNTFFPPPSLVAIGPGPASGDSGAAYLEQASFTAGAPKVQAVNTGNTVDSNGIPNHGLGTRTSIHKTFLTETAVHAASVGSYPIPAWAGGTSDLDSGPQAQHDGGSIVTDGGSSSGDAGAGNGDTGGSDSSCSAAPGSHESTAFGFGAFVALGLLVSRRRRRN